MTKEEITEGGVILQKKLVQYKPRITAFLGLGAYRIAFQKSQTLIGKQPEKLNDSSLWVLPNPSGLNASYTLEKLTAAGERSY